MRKIEAKRKEREKKAHDLQRLINATAERISVSPDRFFLKFPNKIFFSKVQHVVLLLSLVGLRPAVVQHIGDLSNGLGPKLR